MAAFFLLMPSNGYLKCSEQTQWFSEQPIMATPGKCAALSIKLYKHWIIRGKDSF